MTGNDPRGNDDRKMASWTRQTLFFDIEPDSNGADRRDRVLAEVYRRAEQRQRRRRRRGWAGSIIAVAVIGGGATAAAWLWGEQPSSPEGGATCRESATSDSDAIGIAPGQNLVEACAARWADGVFGPQSSAPSSLVACVNEAGAIDVVPGDQAACQAMGLTPAAPELSDENTAIVELQERLIAEINAQDCRPVSDVAIAAERILRESGLSGWSVVIEANSTAGVCGQAAVESQTKTIHIHEF